MYITAHHTMASLSILENGFSEIEICVDMPLTLFICHQYDIKEEQANAKEVEITK